MLNYLYIFGTVAFTVYGQLILKWQIGKYGQMPNNFFEKIFFLLKLLLNPWIFSGFFAAFLASLCWMAAMTKFDLSYAYPFMGLNFVLVFFLSIFLFNEPFSFLKILGLVLIVLGILITSKS